MFQATPGMSFHDCVSLFQSKRDNCSGAYDTVPEVVTLLSFIHGDKDGSKFVDILFDEAGHRVATQYLLAALDGKLPVEHLLHYREANSHLPGHPELSTPGVKFSSGRLGHMWALVNGVAFANREKSVFMLGSDGSQQEGDNAEAARLAVAKGLNVKLFLDDNNVTIAYVFDAFTSFVTTSEDCTAAIHPSTSLATNCTRPLVGKASRLSMLKERILTRCTTPCAKRSPRPVQLQSSSSDSWHPVSLVSRDLLMLTTSSKCMCLSNFFLSRVNSEGHTVSQRSNTSMTAIPSVLLSCARLSRPRAPSSSLVHRKNAAPAVSSLVRRSLLFWTRHPRKKIRSGSWLSTLIWRARLA